MVAELRKEESDLAELLMQRLIPKSAFRTEQRRIKTQIAELTAKINEQRGKIVRESDYMAAQTNVDQDTVDSLRQMCLKDVKRAQGTIRLEDAYRFQKPPVK